MKKLNTKSVREVFAKRKSIAAGSLLCFYIKIKNEQSGAFAVAVASQVKTKPDKNKIKRRLRSLIIGNEQLKNLSLNVVFLAKAKVLKMPYLDLKTDFEMAVLRLIKV